MPSCGGNSYLDIAFGKHTQVPENSGNDLNSVLHRFLKNDEVIF